MVRWWGRGEGHSWDQSYLSITIILAATVHTYILGGERMIGGGQADHSLYNYPMAVFLLMFPFQILNIELLEK